jgi:predicted amino acid racemase
MLLKTVNAEMGKMHDIVVMVDLKDNLTVWSDQEKLRKCSVMVASI